MIVISEPKSRINQYRIITIEDDYFVAESSPPRSQVKTLCKIKKNNISQDFQIDQEVFLKVEHLPDDIVVPISHPQTFNAIAALLMVEDFKQAQRKVNRAKELLNEGLVEHLEIEAGILAVASNPNLEPDYINLRIKLIRNQDALIRNVVDNNGHIDYPHHETNPKFIQICKSYLHSIRFEERLGELNTKPYRGAMRYAVLFSDKNQ